MDVKDVRYCRIDLLSPWFPEVNPDHPRARTWNNWLSRQDVLLATATVSCLTVLVVNLTATALVQAKFKAAGIILTLFEGSCSRVKTNDTIYHILINILSTLLLGASNLSMQLLAAPTRREVDKAHSEGKWLDIGVPSWRNLRSISRIRLLMWWCLALSSIPLHFVYNSAISVSLPAHGYAGAFVSESFLRGAPWGDASRAISKSVDWPPKELFDPTTVLKDMQAAALDGRSLLNRSKWDCLETYSDIYGDRSNLLLVIQDAPGSENASLIQYEYRSVSRYDGDLNWPCWDTPRTIPECLRPETMSSVKVDRWTKSGREVLYCMSQKRAKELCRLNYSPTIMIVICCVSGFKCLCFVLTTYMFQKRREVTLRTIGDGISSFLEVQDPYTVKLGIVTKNLLRQKHVWRSASSMVWQPGKTRWYAAASLRRWILTTFMYSRSSTLQGYVYILSVGSTRDDEENWYEQLLERFKLRLWDCISESLYRLFPPSPGSLRNLFFKCMLE
ncbi:hypothetical protein MMC29_001324 [Sticta canariensis]|nr:hypothetical protein [Sticta canariensis]